jgi:hypothetical protein
VPAYTWPVISLTPGIALTVAGLLSGVTWIVQRRMTIAAAAPPASKQPRLPEE